MGKYAIELFSRVVEYGGDTTAHVILSGSSVIKKPAETLCDNKNPKIPLTAYYQIRQQAKDHSLQDWFPLFHSTFSRLSIQDEHLSTLQKSVKVKYYHLNEVVLGKSQVLSKFYLVI